MIDTGASANVIKIKSVLPAISISSQDTILLSGITSEKLKTLRTVIVRIFGYPVTLHVVPDNFPIPQDGILGSEFLRGADFLDFVGKRVSWQGIDIPFLDQDYITLPARSRSAFYIKVANAHVHAGYVPRLEACEGIYLGNAVVTNHGGRAYMYAINTPNEDYLAIVPTIDMNSIMFKPAKEKITELN
jgi:hypothetical protein